MSNQTSITSGAGSIVGSAFGVLILGIAFVLAFFSGYVYKDMAPNTPKTNVVAKATTKLGWFQGNLSGGDIDGALAMVQDPDAARPKLEILVGTAAVSRQMGQKFRERYTPFTMPSARTVDRAASDLDDEVVVFKDTKIVIRGDDGVYKMDFSEFMPKAPTDLEAAQAMRKQLEDVAAKVEADEFEDAAAAKAAADAILADLQ